MQSIFLKLRSWWETADRTQKSVTIFGSLFLVMLIMGTLYFAGRPKMDVLFRNLSPQDQGMVASELTKMGVQFEQDRSGAVLVPADRIAEIQGKLAVAQKLPATGQAGYADLDKLGIMNTPTAEREKIRSILEGEIAKSISEIAGVSGARVHLVDPKQSPFVTETEQSSASVIIQESTEGAVGPAQARAIQRLVQYAVQGLAAKNITVVSDSGRTLIDGEQMATGTGLANDRMAAEIQEAKRREALLQARMDAVFGKGNTVVSVPVLELNYDQKEQSSVERVPTKASSIEKVTESMGANSATAGGMAGTPSNTPGGAGTNGNTSDNKSYTNTQEAKTMEVSETHTNTVFAPGSLKKMAINVLVNNTVVKDETAVKNVIKGELGPLAADTANYTTQVTSVAFDTKANDEMKVAETAAKSSAMKQQVLSILPIAALIFVAFMVVKAIGKASKSGNMLVAVGPGGAMMPMDAGQVWIEQDGAQIAVAANSKLALEAAKSGKVVGAVQREVRHGEGQLVGNDEHLEDKQAQLKEFVNQSDRIRIAKIPDHINVPLEQIKNLAEERPENVAMLLKTWLLSER